jgi:outer-membrane receptor for ferric coprogen and ferric-rhodotorulic acid
VTPFLGAVYKLTDQVSAYASYTDIFKDQNYLDSSGHYLAPIEGVNKEVGIKAALLDERLNVSLSAFRITQDNLGVLMKIRKTSTRCNRPIMRVRAQPAKGWSSS